MNEQYNIPLEYEDTPPRQIATELTDDTDVAFQLARKARDGFRPYADIATGTRVEIAALVNKIEALPTTPDGWSAYYSKLVLRMRAEQAGTLPVAKKELARAAFSQDNYGPVA